MSTELMVNGTTWALMKDQCGALVKSKFLPDSITTPEQALAIALKGHEIGMPMMQAFSHIHIIKGKPTISAEGMNALIRKNCPKAKLEILKNDNEVCTIRATRPGESPFVYTYAIDDAKRAGITGNPSWSKYPDAMLFARCISVIGRRVFPDCLQGISYTPEELGATVNEDGEVIEIHPTSSTENVKKIEKESKPEIIKYDPSNKEHREQLAVEAKKFSEIKKEDLIKLSNFAIGTPMEELNLVVEDFVELMKQGKKE